MLALYAHPFSSYCQKVIIALTERAVPYELKLLSADTLEHGAAFATLWPVQRMPVLADGATTVCESTIIIEHLDLLHGDPALRMIPADPKAALAVRFLDRVFDNYVMTPMQRIVFDHIRPVADRDPVGVQHARDLLDRAYGWLEANLPMSGTDKWAAGGWFGLADCAAAPALFFADWVHPIPPEHGRLRAYRAQVLARPSVKQTVDAARPYRHLFPPGAPDRD